MRSLSSWPRPAGDTGISFTAPQATHPLGREEHWARWIAEMKAMGTTWYKALLDAGAGDFQYRAIRRLIAEGFMVVVRLYRERPNPGRMNDALWGVADECQKLGVRYFEVNNEPNLNAEWQSNMPSMEQAARVCAQNWVMDAESIIPLGAYPAIPAMSPGGDIDDMWFLRVFLDEIKGQRRILEHSWLAVHNYTLNHPLDYPDDPINRAEKPNGSIMDPGESNGFRKFEAVWRLCKEVTGMELPVIATEGGPVMDVGFSPDTRYPKINTEFAHALVAQEIAWRMMHGKVPDYYFASCYWLLANRLHENPTEGTFEGHAWYPFWKADGIEAVQVLKAMPKQARPPIAGVPPQPEPELPAVEPALLRYAREHNLGDPLTGEFDLGPTRWQVFDYGTLFVVVPNWADIRCIQK